MTPEDRGPTPFFLDFPTRDRERLGQGGEAGLVRSAAGGEDTGPPTQPTRMARRSPLERDGSGCWAVREKDDARNACLTRPGPGRSVRPCPDLPVLSGCTFKRFRQYTLDNT